MKEPNGGGLLGKGYAPLDNDDNWIADFFVALSVSLLILFLAIIVAIAY